MAGARILDVSALPAPEPLEQVLAALPSLGPGEYLHVLHRREPWPLFELLEAEGFEAHMQPGGPAGFEILIWRRGDAEAAAAAAEHFT